MNLLLCPLQVDNSLVYWKGDPGAISLCPVVTGLADLCFVLSDAR